MSQTALSPTKVRQMASMFKHLDYDRNGTLDLDEIQQALETICYNELKAQEILAKFEVCSCVLVGKIHNRLAYNTARSPNIALN